MSKLKLTGKSDYVKLKEELELYKSRRIALEDIIYNLKKMNEKAKRVEEVERVLNKILDLINSSEELVHFESAKKEIRKPIEDYFKSKGE